MKPGAGFTVRRSGHPPMNKIDVMLMLGGLLAAMALGVVCGLGLLVWLAGGKSAPPK